MFERIMLPVDLAHVDKQTRALDVAAMLAKADGGAVTYLSVTGNVPGGVAHNPAEFETKLRAFAEEQAAKHGIATDAHMMVSHDPVADLDDKIVQAAKELKVDAVVMASHIPGLADHLWPSNGGQVAAHSAASVFVVRDKT